MEFVIGLLIIIVFVLIIGLYKLHLENKALEDRLNLHDEWKGKMNRRHNLVRDSVLENIDKIDAIAKKRGIIN